MALCGFHIVILYNTEYITVPLDIFSHHCLFYIGIDYRQLEKENIKLSPYILSSIVFNSWVKGDYFKPHSQMKHQLFKTKTIFRFDCT